MTTASAHKNGRSRSAGIFFAIMATVVWSGNFIVSREMVGLLPPGVLSLCRWGTAFILLLPFSLKTFHKERQHCRAHLPYYAITAFVGISFFNTALYYAAHWVPALNLSLIAVTSPIFTLLLARILWKEPISVLRGIGLVVVLAGVLTLITKGNLQSLLSIPVSWGDALALVSAFSFAVYTLLVRKAPSGASQCTFLFMTFGLGSLFLIPLGVWEMANGAEVVINAKVLGLVLYLGAGPALFSFWAWNRAIYHIGPGSASLIYYTIPLLCGIQAVLLLGETANWVHWLSGALILGGLVLATRQPSAEGK